MNVIITFGQDHTHRVNGITFDCDCVARIKCNSHGEGRDEAFKLFGAKWCFSHNEKDFVESGSLKHFPRGIIDINQ